LYRYKMVASLYCCCKLVATLFRYKMVATLYRYKMVATLYR
jgi:hypothetical protein